MQTMIPIIKITGNFCNLRCDYCFYSKTDQAVVSVMSYKLLEKFLIEYIRLFAGRLSFIWHGGEPLLAGLPFFQKIVDIQTQLISKNQTVKNSIQTNATLIDDDWASFFKENNFRVGVSLDGDKESHNRFRKKSNGKGSFGKVMQGVDTLRKHDIKPGFIQTLAVDNLSQTKKNFDFFITADFESWSTNIYYDVYGENKYMLDQNISNKQFTAFLIKQIDLWLERDDSNLRIREIENFLSAVFGKKARNCSFNGYCDRYLCIEYNGEVYPCDRLSNHPGLLFGDISKSSLFEVLNSKARLKYAEKIKSLPSDCLSCEWQKSCNNGCTAQRVGGIDGKYYFCEARKTLFAYLKSKLSKKGGEEKWKKV